MTIRDAIVSARQNGPVTSADGLTSFEFRFAADAPFFAGHFPGHPILPGIFQLEMARCAAEWTLERPIIIQNIRKAKFTRPVKPGETLRLSLKLTEDGSHCLAVAKFICNNQPVGETQLRLSHS